MAANRIQLKRTFTSGRTPNTTNSANSQYIDVGELALNLADGVLYTSNGSALVNLTPTPVAGSVSVRTTNGNGGTVNTSVNNVTGINFDESTGFHVTDQGSGNVFVSLGSGYKYITVSGQTTITAVGEDTLNVANGDFIYLTTSNTAPKTLTISANLSSFQTTAGLSANVATLTANAAGYLNGKTESNLNVNNAVTVGGNTASDLRTYASDLASNAYSNATTYASNATNISSGTLAEARLPYRMNQNVTTTSNVTFANVAMTSGTISTAPVYGTDIVNKTYADAIASGVNFHPAVRLVTNTDLGTATYDNGSSGVGATITKSSSYAALVIDTVTAAYQDRILVRAQANAALNGVYSVSNTGSGSYAWVLTRAYDYDVVGAGVNEIDRGDLFYVLDGSVGAGTAWVQQNDITTIGTDGIQFVQFSSKALYALTSGSGLYYSAGGSYDGSAASTLAVNTSYIATLSANNSSYLGTIAAENYVQNTDSRTLSGNLYFTGANSYFGGKTTHAANLVLNPGISIIDSTGSQGTVGQVLTSNGTSNVYWADSAGGGGSVNVAAQYAWTNTQSFSNTITFTGSILANTVNAASYTIGSSLIANTTQLTFGTKVSANGSVGTSGQILASNGSSGTPYWRSVVRANSQASSASVTIDGTLYDTYIFTALAADITFNASSLGINGKNLLIRIRDNGTIRSITWATGTNGFRAIGLTLPTLTVANKLLYIGLVYNADDQKWDAIAYSLEA
jgi:hypothetical protein